METLGQYKKGREPQKVWEQASQNKEGSQTKSCLTGQDTGNQKRKLCFLHNREQNQHTSKSNSLK